MSHMFYNCNLLIELWEISTSITFDNLLAGCDNLNIITLKDNSILNYIVDYLPIKSINNEGSLIIANKTGLDTSILLNKYWNIV